MALLGLKEQRLPERVQLVVDQLLESKLNKTLAQDTVALLQDMASRLSPEELIVSVNDRTAVRRGRVVQLSPNQASALHCLWLRGGIVPLEDISRAVYGCLAEQRSINNIRVIMNDLRVRLHPLTVNVINNFGRGYQLEVVPIQEKAA